MTFHVAFLRGINVGGNNRLAMATLAELFTTASCTNVRTYIQSGNVIFSANATLARRIPTVIAAALAERCGLTVPVITRSAAELRAIASSHALGDPGATTHHVGFLAATPDAPRVANLDPQRSPGDRFVVTGREIYIHAPAGLGRSKLTVGYFDRALAATTTIRNWQTVGELCALLP